MHLSRSIESNDATDEFPGVTLRPQKPLWREWLPVLAVILVLAAVGLWLHGNLDRALYPIGLNHGRCARNGFGASFCGQELREYEKRISTLTRSAE